MVAAVQSPAESTPKRAPQTGAHPAVPDRQGLRDVMAFLGELLAEGRHGEVLQEVQALLFKMLDHQEDLGQQLAALRKRMFGRSSEQLSASQLQLFLDEAAKAGELDAPVPPVPPPDDKPDDDDGKPDKQKHKRPGRNKLPEHLKRNEIELKVPEDQRACTVCGAQKVCIGHEESEVLNYVPGHFEVDHIKREKLACKPCAEGVVVAPPASKLQGGGMCGPGLLAQVLIAKYLDHLPLYRQHLIYLRSGVHLAESTLGLWVRLGHELLLPVAKGIWRGSLTCGLIGADDTPMMVLDEDSEKGRKRGHIWAILGYDDQGQPRYASMRYTENWQAKGPREFLLGFAGVLQGDGYKGWLGFATLLGLVVAGCMAHARRKLVEAVEGGQLGASVGLALVRQLYAIEAAARDAKLNAADRQALRQEQAAPVMAKLRQWVTEQLPKQRPTSGFGKALTYLHNQWAPLSVYVSDGRVPIDNNLVENQLRPVCLGKKNYLFAGSDAGGERMATIYTVLATCKVVGVDPWKYLNAVLPVLAERGSDADVADLLPHAWRARQAAVLAKLPLEPGGHSDAAVADIN